MARRHLPITLLTQCALFSNYQPCIPLRQPQTKRIRSRSFLPAQLAFSARFLFTTCSQETITSTSLHTSEEKHRRMDIEGCRTLVKHMGSGRMNGSRNWKL